MKDGFLISHYSYESLANIHFVELENDGNGFAYNISNPKHEKKLKIAREQPAGFSVNTPLFVQKI